MSWPHVSESLVAAFYAALPSDPSIERRTLFGCPSAFLRGHLAVGTHGHGIVLKLSAEDRARLQAAGQARPFEPMPGRPMRELVVLDDRLAGDPCALGEWVERALAYVGTLPPRIPGTPTSAPPGARPHAAGAAPPRRGGTAARRAIAPKAPAIPSAVPDRAAVPVRPTGTGTVDSLPGLGPASRAALAAAGIDTVARLRELGAVLAFVAVERAGGRPSLNLLWSIEAALGGGRWQEVARLHRTSLLLALDRARAG
jgi:DNA transformation protein